jgi:hypothetical protein
MTQQPLSGFEIQELAKKITENSKKTDSSLESVVVGVLSEYILLPKYTPTPTPTPKGIN